jgi:patatin-like phospholipase/acyl hydrolase
MIETPVSDGGSFSVLSLDGGGIRGAFSATLLAAVEERCGVRLVDYFDLVTGTSTGGIIALGIAAGLPAAQIRDFYLTDGPAIFPPLGGVRRIWRLVASTLRPKHSQAPLRAALERVFGSRTMGTLQTRVVIPTFSATAGRIRLFKTRHHERVTHDPVRKLVDVGLATSAAPYFLPGHTTTDGERFVDGGIWANTPIAVGVIEAVGYLGIPRDRIRVLSVGTTSEPYHLEENTVKRGIAGLLLGALRGQSVGLFMAGQMTAAYAQAKVLLGAPDRLLRIDPPVASGRFKLDRSSDVEELRGLGTDAATHAMPEIRRLFLAERAPPFHPAAPVHPSD